MGSDRGKCTAVSVEPLKPEKVTTMVTVKTQTTKERHIVDDYSFGDVWLTLTLEDGDTLIWYYMAWVESVEVSLY